MGVPILPAAMSFCSNTGGLVVGHGHGGHLLLASPVQGPLVTVSSQAPPL